MENKKKEAIESILPLLHTTRAKLTGKQSVRATFKLSEKTICAISIVSSQLGIKQKSLFDHMFEDTLSLLTIEQEIENSPAQRMNAVQKTYVISKRTLHSLENISKKLNTPRDKLIECLVEKLTPIIKREKEKHQIRKEVLGDMKEHFLKGLNILEDAGSSLGEDDPVFERLRSVMAAYDNAVKTIDHFVKKGDVIEDF